MRGKPAPIKEMHDLRSEEDTEQEKVMFKCGRVVFQVREVAPNKKYRLYHIVQRFVEVKLPTYGEWQQSVQQRHVRKERCQERS